ncbi:HAMP domain-containing histidine kinase [Streptomyces ipomoeae]|nr:HAMP domain-containing sensor histidine kinase [Streptomyces ipomoeae]MDX2695056.1 HAMP domain-containing sensor histidine kinase [Streptomyces ipomoeae]MDX2820545.1 HAMP domain-containing sensor histidine kinase [Streptomyces ipomoeae]MDX2840283.1 HAMP domain-containing sensor histidine kinase [Streptomyces ipomoeae]MDX2875426.1 HAMP domain-containing sensor histidine kinase [Streptomyces ipomoeae]TQE15694.1 HAMP domain-containing histidine kinase [Streptomyces ipomoeae]
MAVALASVAATTRSILLRDVDQRISELLAQEAGEFTNLEAQGVDPQTGRPFTDPSRLLRVFLQRQNADPDEELMGLVGRAGGDPTQIIQQRDIPVALPLHEDADARRRIFDSPESTGTLERSAGEIRWAKVEVARYGDEANAAFVVAFHPASEKQRADEVFQVLLAISGVALLMATGIAWVVAGRILKPVRLVRTTAAQLTEQDLTRRIPVHGRDDVAALAETFNAMLDRLERAFAAQRQFVDDAGHELRTPITIVRGHLELMGDDPGEREETIRLVTDELDRMSRIVEDLLLLAKAERPDFVRPEPVQLAELTADVYVKARTLGERDWQLAEVADREAELDPQRITQAMVQLAQNAVQHTTTGQTIRIGSRAEGSAVELYVVDSGPGVQPQDAQVIFERFRRGTARRGARGSGAGLGLSIVRAIAEAHGGRVRLHDTEGGGATFVLTLEEART